MAWSPSSPPIIGVLLGLVYQARIGEAYAWFQADQTVHKKMVTVPEAILFME